MQTWFHETQTWFHKTQTWFFRCKLEFHQTQTWFHRTQTWFHLERYVKKISLVGLDPANVAHANIQPIRCGLFINEHYPCLHATPDFLTTFDCCSFGCGEVNCLICIGVYRSLWIGACNSTIYIPVTAFSYTDLFLDHIYLERDSRGSAITNHNYGPLLYWDFHSENSALWLVDSWSSALDQIQMYHDRNTSCAVFARSPNTTARDQCTTILKIMTSSRETSGPSGKQN